MSKPSEAAENTNPSIKDEAEDDEVTYLPKLSYDGPGDIPKSAIERRQRDELLMKKYGISLFDLTDYT